MINCFVCFSVIHFVFIINAINNVLFLINLEIEMYIVYGKCKMNKYILTYFMTMNQQFLFSC